MPSIMVNIGLEVEIFYEERDGEYEPIHAVVQTAGLPIEMEQYARVAAIEKFERNPRGCIAAYEKGGSCA